MFRTLLVPLSLIAAIWGISGHHAAAQGGAGSAPAQIVLILHKNPLLAEVNRVSASDLERIVKQLDGLANGRRPPRTRTGGGPPTPEENRQIAANPLFATAYRQYPENALETLREANRLIDAERH
jgi:hypothetical protein